MEARLDCLAEELARTEDVLRELEAELASPAAASRTTEGFNQTASTAAAQRLRLQLRSCELARRNHVDGAGSRRAPAPAPPSSPASAQQGVCAPSAPRSRAGSRSGAARRAAVSGNLRKTPSTNAPELHWPLAADGASAASTLPGRCCRALPGFRTTFPMREPRQANPVESGTRGSGRASTFGSGPRFGVLAKADCGGNVNAGGCGGSLLRNPDDRCLSTRTGVKSAFIPPLTPTKGRRRAASSACKEPTLTHALMPGLRGVQGAWVALVREMMVRQSVEGDGASTEAGSEADDRTEESSFWSSNASEVSEVPGPGSYSPDFGAVKPRAARGAPSFARYSAREPPSVRAPDEVDAGGDATASSLLPPATLQSQPQRTTRGGRIAPPPSSRPRRPTVKELEAKSSSRRPFYDPSNTQVVASPAVPTFGPGFGAERSSPQRSPRRTADPRPGPGSYEMRALVPGGRAAHIAPEALPRDPRQCSEPPGPAHYEPRAAKQLVYPGLAAVRFGPAPGHTMAFQRSPVYVARYKALHPRWEAVRRRSLSAVITPLRCSDSHATSIAAAASASTNRALLGPGRYNVDDWLTRRLRPDRGMPRWIRPPLGAWEHARGLYRERPVDRAVRGDPRPLLAGDADSVLRRRGLVAFFRPLSEPPRLPRRGGVWRFYDPASPESPEGLADFARRIRFDEFRERETIWLRQQARAIRRAHPNFQLSYSLPSLEITKARAPRPDFASQPERAASDPGDGSPREGDVLMLSLGAERELFHPRSPFFVDMARQRGRASSEPPDAVDMDDYEELLLSPRRVGQHSPMYVDMARTGGRPFEPELSAHLWADQGGVVYAYQPTSGLRPCDEDADLLTLSVDRADAMLRRRPRWGDFATALGRPGVDPRVPGGEDGHHPDDEAILTHWAPRFRRPAALPVEAGEEDASFARDAGGIRNSSANPAFDVGVVVEQAASPDLATIMADVGSAAGTSDPTGRDVEMDSGFVLGVSADVAASSASGVEHAIAGNGGDAGGGGEEEGEDEGGGAGGRGGGEGNVPDGGGGVGDGQGR